MRSLRGRIVSFDPVLHLGTIQPDSSTQGIVFLEGNLHGYRGSAQSTIGAAVTFDLIETEKGRAAVNIRLIRRSASLPNGALGILAAPILVAIATYLCMMILAWPALHSYVVSINLVSFLLIVITSRMPFNNALTPAEMVTIAIAIAGGSLGVFLASLTVRTRFRSDAARFCIVALIIAQGFLIHRYQPSFFSRYAWEGVLNSLK